MLDPDDNAQSSATSSDDVPESEGNGPDSSQDTPRSRNHRDGEASKTVLKLLETVKGDEKHLAKLACGVFPT